MTNIPPWETCLLCRRKADVVVASKVEQLQSQLVTCVQDVLKRESLAPARKRVRIQNSMWPYLDDYRTLRPVIVDM